MIHNSAKIGRNVVIGENVSIGRDVVISDGVVIGNNVSIGDGSFVDYRAIFRDNTSIAKESFVGADCILGEYQLDFIKNRVACGHILEIGEKAVIRSGSIIYSGSKIGSQLSTGHRVTIREQSTIGNNCVVGTMSDIQGYCTIGNHVHMHSNVHIGQESIIDDYVWLFPYTILTNDPTPPSRPLYGVHINSFAVIASGTILLPGVVVESDTLTAAGAVVGKDVKRFTVVGGCPAKVIGDVRKIKNRKTGEFAYPWRYHFSEQMPWQDDGFEEWLKKCDVEWMIGLDKYTKQYLD